MIHDYISFKAMQVTNVTLNVKDLNKMNHFYSEILGFSIKRKLTHKLFLMLENMVTLTLHL